MTKKYKTSFEINKLISISGLFSKVKMPISARMVLRTIADYWNYNRGEAFPTQKTIAYNTGLDVRTVRYAIEILTENNLIEKKLSRKRYYYKFTKHFYSIILSGSDNRYNSSTEEKLNTNTGTITRYIEESSSANNIIKYNKNTSFLNSEEEETDDCELNDAERYKMLIEKFKDNPALKGVVYNLTLKLKDLTSSQEH